MFPSLVGPVIAWETQLGLGNLADIQGVFFMGKGYYLAKNSTNRIRRKLWKTISIWKQVLFVQDSLSLFDDLLGPFCLRTLPRVFHYGSNFFLNFVWLSRSFLSMWWDFLVAKCWIKSSSILVANYFFIWSSLICISSPLCSSFPFFWGFMCSRFSDQIKFVHNQTQGLLPEIEL